MCTTCGCAVTTHEHAPVHEGASGHQHHTHDHGARTLTIGEDLLAVNAAHAARTRRHLARTGIFALNLMSSPGAGKTTLLERTVADLSGRIAVAVIEGDQQTSRDAERIRAAGAPAVQVNTGVACHLDAHMVGHALEELVPAPDSLLFIENVGNLVCPAAFDLGESRKVVILSVTEGEDKPLKYPHMFVAAHALVVAKTDLLPHLEFELDQCIRWALQVNPALEVFPLSARTGAGMEEWVGWLLREAAASRAAAGDRVPAADELSHLAVS